MSKSIGNHKKITKHFRQTPLVDRAYFGGFMGDVGLKTSALDTVQLKIVKKEINIEVIRACN